MSRMPVIVSSRNRKKLTPPMHHVYCSFTPPLRARAGCRCRKTFDSTASAWFRGLFGVPCRKIDFQICDSVIISRSFWNMSFSGGLRVFQEGLGVEPLTLFFLELLRLVHEDLPVVREPDLEALERAGSRAL